MAAEPMTCPICNGTGAILPGRYEEVGHLQGRIAVMIHTFHQVESEMNSMLNRTSTPTLERARARAEVAQRWLRAAWLT